MEMFYDQFWMYIWSYNWIDIVLVHSESSHNNLFMHNYPIALWQSIRPSVIWLMNRVWASPNMSRDSKMRSFLSLVGADERVGTLTTKPSIVVILQTFVNQCLRHILTICINERSTFREIWTQNFSEEMNVNVDRSYPSQTGTVYFFSRENGVALISSVTAKRVSRIIPNYSTTE